MTAAGHDFRDDLARALPRVTKFAITLAHSREVGRDLAQDTAVRALSRRHLFASGTNFDAWLTTICRNLWVDRVRHARRVRLVPPEPDDDALRVPHRLAVAPAQDWTVELRETLTAFAALDPDSRAVLTAATLGDPYDVIAAKFAIPLGTVRSRLWRARRRLAGEAKGWVK